MATPARPRHAPVRFYHLKKTGFLDGNSSDLALVRSCARIRGYLHAALARGATYKIWDKHAFVKKSGLRMHYVEQAMRTFRKTTTEFDITQIRLGRSPRLKITWRGATGGAGSINEVRARLVGYIRTAAAANKSGVAKVDARFLEYFLKTSGLPREVVGQVWLRLSYVPGCRCHWRGVGGNLRLVVQRIHPAVSLQESSDPYGSPSERRDKKKTGAPPSPWGEHGGASPPRVEQAPTLRSPPSGRPTISADPPTNRSTRRQRTPETPNPRTTTKGRSAPGRPASFAPPLPRPGGELGQSFQVDGRWIAGERLLAKAQWMAAVPMRELHADWGRVRWRFAHARNFAARALRFGHAADAILAAYLAGVRRSHDDAGLAGEAGQDVAAREPSAAVSYAWRVLMADTRSREQRWQAIFETAPAPRPAGVAGSRASAAAPKKARADLRALAPQSALAAAAPAGDHLHTHGLGVQTIEAELDVYLGAHNFTRGQFNALPWDAKKRLLQAAISQCVARAKNNK